MIVFDAAKDAANIAKHGVSLALAEELNLDAAVIVEDRRADYGEARFNAYGLIDNALFALTYTERDGQVRAISLRRAREKELRQWLRR